MARPFLLLAERQSALLHGFVSACTLVSFPLMCSLARSLLGRSCRSFGLAIVFDLAFICGLHPGAGHFIDLGAFVWGRETIPSLGPSATLLRALQRGRELARVLGESWDIALAPRPLCDGEPSIFSTETASRYDTFCVVFALSIPGDSGAVTDKIKDRPAEDECRQHRP